LSWWKQGGGSSFWLVSSCKSKEKTVPYLRARSSTEGVGLVRWEKSRITLAANKKTSGIASWGLL